MAAFYHVVSTPVPAAADPLTDAHIAGYALAILEQDFKSTNGSITVREGQVTVVARDIRGPERDRLESALRRIRGVRGVEIRSGQSMRRELEAGGTTLSASNAGGRWFPRGRLFEPLHADPRWPHFAAAVRSYTTSGEGDVDTAFAGDLGETLSLYRNRAPFGQWDLGVQAGVFSLFDVGSASKHLINADYIIGLITSYRSGDWSLFLRYLHQSSHLGDEFLLNGGADRTNVSYEMIDAKLSYDLLRAIRLYGGLGTLVRRDPSDLSPIRIQYGLEGESPVTFLTGIRPVAYADFQTHQQDTGPRTRWTTNISLRAGFQFEHVRVLDRSIQLLMEYYSGSSPNGQFFLRRIETVGVGLHVYF